MIGTILCVIAALLSIVSWFYGGWLRWTALLLASLLSVCSFIYFHDERSGNAAMFLGCLIAWLNILAQLFIIFYV